MMSKYTIIDLFSGAGGLSYGFEMAGCEVKLAIEKDAWAVETYKANHKNQNVFELDITTLPDDYYHCSLCTICRSVICIAHVVKFVLEEHHAPV